jgi:methionine synthase I (cobalamin-dependent)
MTLDVEEFTGTVTICDGAWGTELDRLGCPPGYCREEWNVSHPEKVEKVAAAYVAAGSEIILTNTFQGSRFALDKHGHADQAVEFSRAGAQISRRAAGNKARVFGSIGPSGKMVLTGEINEKQLEEGFREQAAALAEGGADALVIETMSELAEIRAAIRAAKAAGLPVVACMTYDSGQDRTHTMMGVSPEQAVEAATEEGADIVGCNCGIGIDTYITVTGRLRAATQKPIWVKANAGLPEIEGSRVVYRMTPDEYAAKAQQLVEAGANIIGGCCGTRPEFIRALCRNLK